MKPIYDSRSPLALQCLFMLFVSEVSALCQPGYFLSDLKCVPCAAGTYKDVEADTPCQACTKLITYQPETGQTSCLPCPFGAICSLTDYACGAGYQMDLKTTRCVPCQPGLQYKPTVSNESCLACPDLASCNPISFKCNQGYTSNTAVTGCVPAQPSQDCPSGFYLTDSGISSLCKKCPQNSECSKNGYSCLDGFITGSSGDSCVLPVATTTPSSSHSHLVGDMTTTSIPTNHRHNSKDDTSLDSLKIVIASSCAAVAFILFAVLLYYYGYHRKRWAGKRLTTKPSSNSMSETTIDLGSNDADLNSRTQLNSPPYRPERHATTRSRSSTNTAPSSFLEVQSKLDYQIVECIRSGTCASVYLAHATSSSFIDRCGSKAVVAKRFQGHIGREMDAFKQEVQIMRQLSIHPSFCPLVGYDPQTQTILMKCFAYGSLSAFLSNQTQNAWTKRILMDTLLDVTHGIRYLHRIDMVHGDLHAGHVLMDYNAQLGRFRAVLCDFSHVLLLSAPDPVSRLSQHQQRPITHLHTAPELVIMHTKSSVHSDVSHQRHSTVSKMDSLWFLNAQRMQSLDIYGIAWILFPSLNRQLPTI